MRTSVERKDWRAAVTSRKRPRPDDVPLPPEELRREGHPDDWERTDRLLRFPGWHHTLRRQADDSRVRAIDGRARWLEEHDIHTQFLDAGIGCCWFAQLGDKEPVTGETEDEAIERLARENGFQTWDLRRGA